ncbi:MAG: branched-chain amino acid ABC transporter permease [Actinomycetota bacterium]
MASLPGAVHDPAPQTGREARWWRAYLPVAVVAVVLAPVPGVAGGSRYVMTLAISLLTFASYAVAFNLILGSTAQLFLCQGALAGTAAYTAVILGNELAVPLLASIPAGVLLAATLGGLFSWVAARRGLDAIFTGVVTLAFSLVFTNLLLGGRGLTGGETGLVVDADVVGLLRAQVPAYYLLLAVLVVFLAGYRLLERSHHGWAFRALRDDPAAAELAGVDVTRHKVVAGAIGSAMLGTSGTLFALHEGFFSPSTFGFGEVDLRVLVMLAFGGIGTLVGPVVGAVAIVLVDELLRPLAQLRLTVYGLALIGLFLGLRQGVVPVVTRRLRRPNARGGGVRATGSRRRL